MKEITSIVVVYLNLLISQEAPNFPILDAQINHDLYLGSKIRI